MPVKTALAFIVADCSTNEPQIITNHLELQNAIFFYDFFF